jgi:crossover junction endodeoxyribonuclease RuvC
MELGDLPGRLKVLFDGISEVASRYQPEVAAVEIVFVNVNPQSTLLLGQARGAALTALVNANLAVSEYTALQMKKAVSAMVAQPRIRFRKWSNACCNCPACPAPMPPMRWDWPSPMPMRRPPWD